MALMVGMVFSSALFWTVGADSLNVYSIGRWSYGPCRSVWAANGYAYTGAWGGFQAVNVSNPASPTLTGQSPTSGVIYDLKVVGNTAFLADGLNGIVIYDISTPSNPVVLGGLDTPGEAVGIDIAGNYAYIADKSGHLRVVDISDPTNPTEVASTTEPVEAIGVAVQSNYVYVAGPTSLVIFDISNPAAPTKVGTYSDNSSCIFVSGNYAYTGGYVPFGSQTFDVINISDPTAPTRVGRTTLTAGVNDIYVVGSLAYVADGTAGLVTVNVSNPSNPSVVSTVATVGSADRVWADANYGYVAAEEGGLRIFDVMSNPGYPVQVGVHVTPDIARDVTVETAFSPPLACLADGVYGLVIFDGSDPVNLPIYSYSNTPGDLTGVNTYLDTLFAADGDSGVATYNITIPGVPLELGRLVTAGRANDVIHYNDSLMIVAAGDNGVRVIDYRAPFTEIGFYDTPGQASGLFCRDTLLYVADGTGGLEILNMANPASPTLVGSGSGLDDAQGVWVSGNYAYIADYGGATGIHCFDVSNPASPSDVGSEGTGPAHDVIVAGDYAYLAAYNGLFVFDVTTPGSFLGAGFYITTDHAWGIDVVQDTLIYLAAGHAGLWVLRFTGAAPPIDIAVTAITNPTKDTLWTGYKYDPKATVVNLGTTPQSFTLIWQVDTNSVSVHRFPTLVKNLAPGESREVTFSPWTTFKRIGVIYRDSVYTTITNDVDPSNNWQAKTYYTTGGVAVTNPLEPLDTVVVGNDYTPTVELTNMTPGATESFPCSLKIEDGSTVIYLVSEDCAGLNGSEVKSQSFETWTVEPPAGTTYIITAWTSLPNDQDASDDQLSWDVVAVDNKGDVGVVSIDVPTSPVQVNRSYIPQATVKNYGTSPVSFDVTCKIVKGVTSVYDDTVSVATLGADTTQKISFPNWTVSGRGLFQMTVTTQWSGDTASANDSKSVWLTAVGVEEQSDEVPKSFSMTLLQSNPSPGTVEIRYGLPHRTVVRLGIYDITGKQVRTLEEGINHDPGYRTITWSGIDDKGQAVAMGIYFVRMETSHYTATRKFTLIR